MYPTRNTLSENIRAQSVELLNEHLAAAIDLHAQVKQAHWNVRGPGFIAIAHPAKMNMTSHTQAVRHSQQRGATSSYPAMLGAPDSALVDVNGVASDLPDRIETWINEGGAGDDLDR